MPRRSGCPINLTLETFGDRWSLIVLRDIMFGKARTFRALLAGNIEGIASNILADRLARLVAHGLLSRQGDPAHSQRVIYSLTEASIGLVPMMAMMGAWGLRYRSPSPELGIRARLLEDGGPELWAAFMDELRHLHLAGPEPARSVMGELQTAFQAMSRGETV
ncbi:MAG: helix-turn-helix transcriptional regulator [Tabrizicola sp.]|nr:helix-turn-helix transcriptional regulator [Tabrizicola sp.]